METYRHTLTQVCLDGRFRRRFHPFINVHVFRPFRGSKGHLGSFKHFLTSFLKFVIFVESDRKNEVHGSIANYGS